MNGKNFFKVAMVAVAFLFGGALFASSDDVMCYGSATDQFGDPVENATVYSVFKPTISVKTSADGTYSLQGIRRGTPVDATAPIGYTSSGSQQSENLSSSSTEVNFSFHDTSLD